MSADVVNLRMARKAKRREDAAEAGAARRARFGQTRAAREAEAAGRDRAARHLDGHRRETAPDGPAADDAGGDAS